MINCSMLQKAPVYNFMIRFDLQKIESIRQITTFFNKRLGINGSYAIYLLYRYWQLTKHQGGKL